MQLLCPSTLPNRKCCNLPGLGAFPPCPVEKALKWMRKEISYISSRLCVLTHVEFADFCFTYLRCQSPQARHPLAPKHLDSLLGLHLHNLQLSGPAGTGYDQYCHQYRQHDHNHLSSFANNACVVLLWLYQHELRLIIKHAIIIITECSACNEKMCNQPQISKPHNVFK